jgi:hypothetical protein
MPQQYYKYLPVILSLAVLLFLICGESYILDHQNDNAVMTFISVHRQHAIVVFSVLSAFLYYHFCYQVMPETNAPDVEMQVKLPSYEESMSQPLSGSEMTSVTE